MQRRWEPLLVALGAAALAIVVVMSCVTDHLDPEPPPAIDEPVVVARGVDAAPLRIDASVDAKPDAKPDAGAVIVDASPDAKVDAAYVPPDAKPPDATPVLVDAAQDTYVIVIVDAAPDGSADAPGLCWSYGSACTPLTTECCYGCADVSGAPCDGSDTGCICR